MLSSYWLLEKHSQTIESSFLISFLTTFFAYLGGTIDWIPTAARYYSSSSGPAILIFCLGIYSFQALSGVGLGIGYFLARKYAVPAWRPFLVALATTSVLHAVPSLITANWGDCLSVNESFTKLLPWCGTLGVHLLITWWCLEFFNLYAYRSRVGLAIVSIILAMGIFFAPTRERVSMTEKKFLAIQSNTGSTLKKESSSLLEFMQAEVSRIRIETHEEPIFIATPESAFGAAPYRLLTDDQKIELSQVSLALTDGEVAKINLAWIGVFSYLLPPTNSSDSVVKTAPAIAASYMIDENGYTQKIIPKTNLVPFVEYIPFADLFPFLRKIFPWVHGYIQGASDINIPIKGNLIGQFLCYDSMFRSSFWNALKQKSDFVLILANDRGTTEVGARSHQLISRAKAIEYGLPTFFIGNSGFSGLLNDQLDTGEWDQRKSFLFSVPKIQTTGTFYSSFIGWWFEKALLFVGIALIVLFFLQVSSWHRLMAPLKDRRLQGLVVGLILYFLVTQFLINIIVVPTESMVPTYYPGDRVLICFGKRTQYHHGDLVSLLDPLTGRSLIKRIFLGPGDEYDNQNGVSMINHQKLEITPVSHNIFKFQLGNAPAYQVQTDDVSLLVPRESLRLGAGQIFYIGDHRDKSFDSRDIGPVSENAIIGQPCF